MKEVRINSTNANEVNSEIAFESQLINIDSADIRYALTGKSGVMYQKGRMEGESIPDFMNTFFEELKSREQVMESSLYLIHLMIPQTDEFTMDDMGLIHEFIESLGDEKEILWGMGSCKGKNRMTITVLCTKEENLKVNE